VGSVGSSDRFRGQLVDAVESLVVGETADPSVQMGPLIEPPAAKLERALTTLEVGERWLVQPRLLDESGRLWSPGVKAGVRLGSFFHLTECFGPVLGLMMASDLDTALDLQNQVSFGLTAGLQSLDDGEIAHWLERVEAGNVYVNRSITGAVVRRQPFGGWKRSSVGPGAKAGGPNQLVPLTDWATSPANGLATPTARVQAFLDDAGALLPGDGASLLSRAAGSDAAAWRDHFAARDVSGLLGERNVLRHLPAPVTVRMDDERTVDVLRVVAAGLCAGADLRVSLPAPAPALRDLLARHGIPSDVEDSGAWAAHLSGNAPPERVRLIGGSREEFAAASGGRVDIALYDHAVVEAGRVELLAFLREQSVSITTHRFGTPDVVGADLPPTLPSRT
jgi:RHH-type proline utilization regulon transcriptional repressor/proline dehydrogenase/delta 1-pyrroline-5-carboxylate dehydrogenase